MTTFFIVVAVCAVLPVLMYIVNIALYRIPPLAIERTAVSLLIPARNEDASITACLERALASRDVDLEIIVLDDGSTDATAAIVRAFATHDARVRLEAAPPLPAEWSGKQHACFTLARLATKPILCFLDADVRLEPDALSRLAAFQAKCKADLVSGFPRQETGTWLEKLVIPLIHIVLLGYLPMAWMRRSRRTGFGTGCGQIFMTTRDAYDRSGGHRCVKDSFHDGVKLPRAYRNAGLTTDLCDLTDFATCRMYRNAAEVWNGLAKNAREGLGGPVAIWVWTLLLLLGHVAPFVLAVAILFQVLVGVSFFELESVLAVAPWLALPLIGLLQIPMRLHAALIFRQSLPSAFLHPLGVLLLIAIQWYATFRYWCGAPVGWKGRTPPA